MNKRQKEILQAQLDNEKAVLKKLESNYADALSEINSKIELLLSRQDADMQHVIYQVEYQKALKTQVQAILETLQTNEFETITGYLTKAYEEGFIGTMYDLQGQGIPLIFPLDQKAVVAAIQNETKLSENLYTALGKDIVDLRKKIAGEISRGLSSGQMYSEISRNIASWARIPKNNAMRITRTEAHRIQCKATADAQHRAKEKGADVVKQWDSTLDSKTRESHVAMDGEVAELDDTFSNGLEYPGDPKGSAEEVINCRCALLQRARWALGNDYTKWSEDAPILYSDDGTTQLAIIEAKNYEDFQKQYKQASERVREGAQKINDAEISIPLEKLQKSGIEYNDVKDLNKSLTDAEIISRLGGGDMTNGSCSSLGFAYMGNKCGYDVLDFRGGESRSFFARNGHIKEIAEMPNVRSTIVKEYNDLKAASYLLQSMEPNKEYYLSIGKHASIVKRAESGYMYLELQSATGNGFKELTTDVLKTRFGCKKTHTVAGMKYEATNILIEAESLQENEEFRKILGYLNTSETGQKKGLKGHVK